jgi:hypothetical protein
MRGFLSPPSHCTTGSVTKALRKALQTASLEFSKERRSAVRFLVKRNIRQRATHIRRKIFGTVKGGTSKPTHVERSPAFWKQESQEESCQARLQDELKLVTLAVGFSVGISPVRTAHAHHTR